jgi:20S proteasome subunit alpha 6
MGKEDRSGGSRSGKFTASAFVVHPLPDHYRLQAPTIATIIEGWTTNSLVGELHERNLFVMTHLAEMDNLLEILLRLVRGERAPAFTAPSTGSSNSAGPLLSALVPGQAHAAQQSHVSLAVLAIYRMAVEYAVKAAGDAGRNEVEIKVGEIIRCIPTHLVYKSMDGIFREWRADKKSGK